MTLSVPDFSTSRVLVAGDLMLDRYWLGPTHRISPEAPVPVVSIKDVEDRAGGAANVAVNIAALGANSEICGVTGQDPEAAALANLLGEAGVTDSTSRFANVRTITKLRVLSRNQQLIRLDSEDDIGIISGVSILDRFQHALAHNDVVVFSDYAKGALTAVSDLIARAKAAGKRVLVDPKGDDFAKYRGASVLTPNMAEFEAVVGTCESEEELAERGHRLCARLELGALLVTRSSRGMTLITPDEVTHFDAMAREVFDVTGAGDTVIATLATALAAGASLTDSAALANLAASIVVGKLGVATVSRSELRQALHRRGIGGRSFLDLPQLCEYVSEAQGRDELVVFTNGCFDILHAGHVAYLEEAKNLGARLIVAVNDDASVARLKGENRPVNPLEDRMAVLSGLAAVDWVIPFSEDTPLQLIETIKPNVLVKGGDYRADDIVGATAVRESGGVVKVLTFKEGRSTTDLIAAIRKL
ncbi:MAG: bifunctional D-glycero-beta-D-manno-heptose-7-phosphate kinase/D-glycero-beta-D-manno-heptose 1-phosphate adenylyltransferase HldE [Gammaproteobacteria bacterium]|nr:bifunctional D-glycero-beta-D-manno-heptose-7-phosphate kinase/D-glycero-beta-D-manno-heptose 1-phosphate adenylyltransferase HldE [Gammaproteobacteria bacterium]